MCIRDSNKIRKEIPCYSKVRTNKNSKYPRGREEILQSHIHEVPKQEWILTQIAKVQKYNISEWNVFPVRNSCLVTFWCLGPFFCFLPFQQMSKCKNDIYEINCLWKPLGSRKNPSPRWDLHPGPFESLWGSDFSDFPEEYCNLWCNTRVTVNSAEIYWVKN